MVTGSRGDAQSDRMELAGAGAHHEQNYMVCISYACCRAQVVAVCILLIANGGMKM